MRATRIIAFESDAIPIVVWGSIGMKPLGLGAALAKHGIARGIAGGSLAGGMQGFEKRDKCSGFRGTQVFSVGRHVAAALDHLADELVLGQAHSNTI